MKQQETTTEAKRRSGGMFGQRYRLFSVFGFNVHLDPSWLVLGVLLTWSLARGLFPAYYEGFPDSVYWWMGLAGTLGLFLSIIFHELCHSLVARKFGIPMKGITLFIFGGVAEMGDEPPDARAEFLMSLSGPAASVLAGVVFLGANRAAEEFLSAPTLAVLEYLGWINLLLAGFNLLPAFPLDGGRILRSILWKWRGSLGRATRTASGIGSLFGILLMLLGLLAIFQGNPIGGIWWILIGLFLKNAAENSYRQVLINRALEGEKIRRFMVTEPVTVPDSISLSELVEGYIYRYHHKMYPVVKSGDVLGCITIRQIKSVPKDEWPVRKVGEISSRLSPENTIRPDTGAAEALSLMSRSGNSRLIVLENDRLAGILSLKDMLQFLSLRLSAEFR
ncbi:MAG: site-2 protease family protein [Syntrophales bacterium]|nr:site-2 protease family protein [Syntrophales bacterium]MDD5232980.1 site-2 protease family protein [Syntrophales bacterium]